MGIAILSNTRHRRGPSLSQISQPRTSLLKWRRKNGNVLREKAQYNLASKARLIAAESNGAPDFDCERFERQDWKTGAIFVSHQTNPPFSVASWQRWPLWLWKIEPLVFCFLVSWFLLFSLKIRLCLVSTSWFTSLPCKYAILYFSCPHLYCHCCTSSFGFCLYPWRWGPTRISMALASNSVRRQAPSQQERSKGLLAKRHGCYGESFLLPRLLINSLVCSSPLLKSKCAGGPYRWGSIFQPYDKLSQNSWNVSYSVKASDGDLYRWDISCFPL